MHISKPYRSLLLLTFSSLLAFSGLSAAEMALVNVSSAGTETEGNGYHPDISADGRYAVFNSPASDVVAGDNNGRNDVFLRDTQTGIVTRVSVSSAGVEGTGHSYNPAISADGRYVVFWSSSPNLVAGDTNDVNDTFLRDTQIGTTTRVSVNSEGEQSLMPTHGPSDISEDGRYIVFDSYAPLVAGDRSGTTAVFLHDTQTGATSLVSIDLAGEEGVNGSYDPAISADGRYVAFESNSWNLVLGDTNGSRDIFLRDTQTGTTTRVSVSSAGAQATDYSRHPSISANGRYVAFQSNASNLVTGDNNGEQDIFLHDTQTGATRMISLNSVGTQMEVGELSATISNNGRYVAFEAKAPSLGEDKYAVFLRDTQTNATVPISERPDGSLATGRAASVADSGRRIVFSSEDPLVAGDSNGKRDVFLRTREQPGDCDIDGDIDVDDVLCTTDLVLDGDAAQDFIHGDCNVDFFLDITDVTCTINKALD